MVCVIPGVPASKSDRFNKLSSMLRVNEMDIISAALSGQLDLSILKSPCSKYLLYSSNLFVLSEPFSPINEEPKFSLAFGLPG